MGNHMIRTALTVVAALCTGATAMLYSVEIISTTSMHLVNHTTTMTFRLDGGGRFTLVEQSRRQGGSVEKPEGPKIDTILQDRAYRLSPRERSRADSLVALIKLSKLRFMQAPASDLPEPQPNYNSQSEFVLVKGLQRAAVSLGSGELSPQAAQDLYNLLWELSAKAK